MFLGEPHGFRTFFKSKVSEFRRDLNPHMESRTAARRAFQRDCACAHPTQFHRLPQPECSWRDLDGTLGSVLSIPDESPITNALQLHQTIRVIAGAAG
jgi:hypothetical protein